MRTVPHHRGGRLAAAFSLVALLGLAAGPGTAARSSGPTVAITAPADGATVAGTTQFRADAASPKVVSRVEFRIDGVLRWTERSAPYVYNGDKGSWDTTKETAGTHSLQVTAIDRAGRTVRDTHVVTVKNGITGPSTPTGFVKTGATETSVSVAWSASTDNDQVVAYRMTRDGTAVGSTTGTSYGFSGLACSTSYVFTVVAENAWGDRSSAATLTAATSACPAPALQPAPAPTSPPLEPTVGPVPDAPAAVFVSTSGSDSGACTVDAPCKTLDRAYRVAQPGEFVEIAAGTYPMQTITVDSAKTSSSDVVFRPAAGASVELSSQTTIYAKHLELRGMRMGSYYVKPGADDVTLRNVKATVFFITSANNVNLIGGEIGPVENVDGGQIKASNTTGAPPPTNLLIDGLYIHDVTRTGVAHVECLQVGSVKNLTIRNSRFNQCGTQGVFINSFGGTMVVDQITIENNWFGVSQLGFNSLIVASNTANPTKNVLIRNNSFAQSPRFSTNIVSGDNVRVVANVGTLSSCTGAVFYNHNVWDNTKCGSTDLQAAPGFVNQGGFDLHLTLGSAAVNHGDPMSYPGLDIDGQARPLGGTPDAGADERA